MSHHFVACSEESPYCGNLCHHRDEAGKFDCWIPSQDHDGTHRNTKASIK